METLIAPLEEIHAYRSAKEAVERGKLPLHLSGCVESQKCHLIYGLGQKKRWRVIIAANEIRAREMAEDYRIFDREVLYYPAKDVIFYSADIRGNALAIERLKVIRALLSGEGGTIITTMDAGMEYTLAMSVYQSAVRNLTEADVIDLNQLSEQLVNMGYQRQAQVEAPGDYSVRGGIIDVFPVTEDCPYRVELWGDEIDTIRSFDVESQRSIERTDTLQIFPASELILTEDEIRQGFQRMKQDEEKVLEQLKKQKKFEASNRLHDMLAEVIEGYEQYEGRMGLEAFLAYFPVETRSLFDCFPAESLFFVDEPARCLEKAQAVETEFRESMENRLENGYILPGQMEVLYSAETVTALLLRKPLIALSMLDTLPRTFTISQQLAVQVQPVGSYNKQFELLVEDLKRWKRNGYRVLLLSASRTRAKRLSQDLNEYEIPAFYREVPDEILEPGQIMVSYGFLRRGFAYGNIKFCVVTESDIFGARQKRKRRKQKQYDGKVIQSFNELNVGDYVVHENHGLGVYRGIEKIQVDQVTKDYIKIEYGDGGNLYVPASGLDVLQKYAGQDAARTPKLNKLDAREWNKTKARVKGAVKEIAKELVQLYAKRQQQKGHSFGADTVWQSEFEELFPFEETQDQLDAIEAVKRDM
ncbi:MAG: transcription-repair coupling factor, partial [Lachnospiraceae bacterium]|nr:transcription-repair coupling factor [Lachnospiraceae bacterium]